MHAWFDLVVSGGCQDDGTLSLSIDPTNVKVDASLGVLAAIAGAFECVFSESGGVTCIQNGVEDTVRAALESLQSSGFTTQGIDQCRTAPGLAWHVQANGDILLMP